MKAILIVEAGATKTESRLLIGEEQAESHISSAINPVTQPDYEASIISLCAQYDQSIDEVYYYGAGCLNDEINSKVAQLIQSHLSGSPSVEVYDDLVGAARAVCDGRPAVVGIIGTGSVVGYSDGHHILEKTPSGGYLLGDEGSGYAVGREIIRRYMRSTLPAADRDILTEKWEMNASEMIAHVYSEDYPRGYIASQAQLINELSPGARESIIKTVIKPLITDLIQPMAERHAVPVHLTGGVVYRFATIIEPMLRAEGIYSSTIARSAIEGLVRYHSS